MIAGMAKRGLREAVAEVEEVALERERQADDEPAHQRHRQAAQAPDDRGRERLHDEERQLLVPSRPNSSARKMPAIAAIDEPSAHENIAPVPAGRR